MKYKNKADFFERTNEEWSKLQSLIDDLTDDQIKKVPSQRTGSMEKSGDSWSAKDILMHLYEWHNMAYGWYEQGLKNDKVIMPAPGYKWSELPALNKKIYDTYKDTSVEQSKKKVKATHLKLINLIKSLSEEQFLEPGQYKWTTKYSLSTYLAGTLGAHYKWAHDTIKKNIKK
jgi:hypothetical protein